MPCYFVNAAITYSQVLIDVRQRHIYRMFPCIAAGHDYRSIVFKCKSIGTSIVFCRLQNGLLKAARGVASIIYSRAAINLCMCGIPYGLYGNGIHFLLANQPDCDTATSYAASPERVLVYLSRYPPRVAYKRYSRIFAGVQSYGAAEVYLPWVPIGECYRRCGNPLPCTVIENNAEIPL